MSVILSDNFDGGPSAFASDWTTLSAGLGVVRGGCGFPQLAATSTPNKWFLACYGNGQVYRSFTPTGTTASARFIYQYKSTSPFLTVHEPLYLVPTGFAHIIGFRSDGIVYARWNDVTSEVRSAPGVFPTDGTPIAVQFRVQITSPSTYDFVIDINNSTVHSGTVGTSFAGWGSSYSRVDLLGNNGFSPFTALDTLEIDNSNASTGWAVCSDITQLKATAPQAVVTGISGTVGTDTLTLTGTGFRESGNPSNTPAGIAVIVYDPNGNLYADANYGQPNAPNATTTVNSTTQITVVLDAPATVTAGLWCAYVANISYCWETPSASQGQVCFDLTSGGPPPGPCDPPTPPNIPYTLPDGVSLQSMNDNAGNT